MKADMEAMKEKMATIMEAMMSMKKIVEVNATAVAATSTVAEVDPTPPFGFNQISHPTSDYASIGCKVLCHLLFDRDYYSLFHYPKTSKSDDM